MKDADPPLKIAIVGTGVSGLVAAHHLARRHQVTVFEAAGYVGGHTHTRTLTIDGVAVDVDSGFIVHNTTNYPRFTRLMTRLGVASQPTSMSFSVKNERSGLEYNAGNLRGLYAQPRNLVSPRFLGMLLDLVRFYRRAPALLESADPGPTLRDYLSAGGYGSAFVDDHLVPMASALWSAPPGQVDAFPARYLVEFMAHHRMLSLIGRPQWRVICGGSRQYINPLTRGYAGQIRLSCPVELVRRSPSGVEVKARGVEPETYDHVVFGCHADDALALLADPSDSERSVLGAIGYQSNDTVLHSDATILPTRRAAWAAWNALVPRERGDQCTVTYNMNILQRLPVATPLLVTLNCADRIRPDAVIERMHYRHPVYTHASVAAQSRWAEVNRERTWYCGAYWGYGFHEDGVKSAERVAEALGVTVE